MNPDEGSGEISIVVFIKDDHVGTARKGFAVREI
jgi:hypothetical protein